VEPATRQAKLWPRDLSDLVETDRRDVLSVYLDVDPTKPENQSAHPAYAIWLRNTLRDILNGLNKDERRGLGKTAEIVETFVASHNPPGEGSFFCRSRAVAAALLAGSGFEPCRVRSSGYDAAVMDDR